VLVGGTDLRFGGIGYIYLIYIGGFVEIHHHLVGTLQTEGDVGVPRGQTVSRGGHVNHEAVFHLAKLFGTVLRQGIGHSTPGIGWSRLRLGGTGKQGREHAQQTEGKTAYVRTVYHFISYLGVHVFAKIRKFFDEMLSVYYFICIFAADL
jgi:hypothetical protein